MMDRDDERILLSPEQSQQFVELLLGYQRRLHRYIITLLPSAPDAEDVLQETVAVLWRKFGEFRSDTNFYVWCCRTAEFKVLEHRRKNSGKETVLDQDIFDRLVAYESRSNGLFEARLTALQQCLDRLKPVDRELINKVYANNCRAKDVAAEIGRPVNSVYQSLSRVRSALLDCIRHKLLAESAQGSEA